MFKNCYGVYENRNICNVNDSRMGNSVEWHTMYSEGRNEVMGFVSPKVTSPGYGMGACEREWGVTNRIEYGQSSNLAGMKIEKLSIISTNQKLNKARIKRWALE